MNLIKKGIVVIVVWCTIAQPIIGEEQKKNSNAHIVKKSIGMIVCAGLLYYICRNATWPSIVIGGIPRDQQAIATLQQHVNTLHAEVKHNTDEIKSARVDIRTLHTFVDENVVIPLGRVEDKVDVIDQKLAAQDQLLSCIAAQTCGNTTLIYGVSLQVNGVSKRIKALDEKLDENRQAIQTLGLQIGANHNQVGLALHNLSGQLEHIIVLTTPRNERKQSPQVIKASS